MAPIRDFQIECKRPGCTGSIWASVFAHKKSLGEIPTCRVCKALPRGSMLKKFVPQPGFVDDYTQYQRSSTLRPLSGKSPTPKGKPNQRRNANNGRPASSLQAEIASLKKSNQSLKAALANNKKSTSVAPQSLPTPILAMNTYVVTL